LSIDEFKNMPKFWNGRLNLKAIKYKYIQIRSYIIGSSYALVKMLQIPLV